MKVEIQQASINAADTLLQVYANDTRPICLIYEEDFIELLSDKDIEKMVKGQIKFNVDKHALFHKAKTIY